MCGDINNIKWLFTHYNVREKTQQCASTGRLRLVPAPRLQSDTYMIDIYLIKSLHSRSLDGASHLPQSCQTWRKIVLKTQTKMKIPTDLLLSNAVIYDKSSRDLHLDLYMHAMLLTTCSCDACPGVLTPTDVVAAEGISILSSSLKINYIVSVQSTQ